MAAEANAQQYEQQAASGTGLPFSVTHQQAIAESGEGANKGPSSAGALGFWQFMPATYNAYASQSGVQPGTEMNTADETKVYITYMNALLKQEGGNIFKTLEAYNAGPGNLQAGASYASSIESKAGVSQGATAGAASSTPTSATLTGFNPLDPFGSIGNTVISGIFSGILKSFGVPSFKDMFQRLGLILFGAVLIYAGVRIMSNESKGGSKNSGGGAMPQQGGSSDESRQRISKPQKSAKPSTEVLSPSTETPAVATEAGGGEAVEMLALA